MVPISRKETFNYDISVLEQGIIEILSGLGIVLRDSDDNVLNYFSVLEIKGFNSVLQNSSQSILVFNKLGAHSNQSFLNEALVT